MTINDVSLIGKKVLVGVTVTLIPFVIIFGGLWLGRKLLEKGSATKTAQIVQPQNSTPS
ncbi:hypothetical protein [Mucilaginibacter sp. R-33]|uniref:hypothetical protein n=1 Tax=Mucilaginibacter sp. R-33 TaxID=3416711 RepID=UPI003CEA80D8